MLVSISLGWALSIGVRFVYPALLPFLQAEFGIGLATSGLLLTSIWSAYALGHIPGGILGDRLGEGNILVLSTAVSTGAIFIVALAIELWLVFMGTVAFGLATALYGPTRFTVLTNIYSNKAGSAIGLTMAVGSLGNTIFPAAAAFIATYLTWRFGFGIFIPFFGLATGALWLAVPSHTSQPTSTVDEFSTRTIKQVGHGITHGSIPVIFGIQIVLSLVMQGFSSFYPTYLGTVKGLSPGVAATLFGLFFAVGAVLQPISGSLMDRIGSRKTLLGFLSVHVLGLWMLPFFSGLGPLIVITVLVSSWNGCIVITQTYIADTLPEELQGTGFGTLKATWMTIGATSPLIIGILADNGYFNESFFLLVVAGTVGLAFAFFYLSDI
jgi:MFS family permease